MSKSYTPLRPKPKKRPPPWATLKNERVIPLIELHTDDTEFGRGLMLEDKDNGVTQYATRRRGKWEEVTIQTNRITRRVPEQGAFFGR